MYPLDDWLSTKEAATLSGYHPDHIRRLLRKGEVSARKWGNAWMVNRNSLLAYLKKIEKLGDKRGPKSE